jgi:ADP-ribose pyrophosphatase YjhB (NUDIX family)
MNDENFPRVLAIQAIILNENNQVLLAKRNQELDFGKWELIAGYWTQGERLEETVKRHIIEKAGIQNYESIEFTGKYYDDPSRHPGKYCIPFVFKVIVKDDVKFGVEDRELRWFDLSEIKDLEMALDNKRSLEDLGLLNL